MTLPTNLESIRARRRAGETFKYVFFWGHTRRGDAIGASCLSNWYPAPFELDGLRYATAEHWMMAGKARLFGDDSALARVLSASHPGEAKKIGREVRGFDEETWVAERDAMVCRGLVAKFSQNAALGAYLRGTRSRVLVEASPVDELWGIGLAADDERAHEPLAWRGLNRLGFLLMEARGALTSE